MFYANYKFIRFANRSNQLQIPNTKNIYIFNLYENCDMIYKSSEQFLNVCAHLQI